MSELQSLKPMDIVVALRVAQDSNATYAQLSQDLGLSTSQVYGSVARLGDAGLLRPSSREVNRLAFREFVEHGIRYAFPAKPGAEVRGVPTAHSASPLASHIVAEDAMVWPSATGSLVGHEVAPLYPRAVELPKQCPRVYEMLTLVDALRVGRSRERKLAAEEFARRLGLGA